MAVNPRQQCPQSSIYKFLTGFPSAKVTEQTAFLVAHLEAFLAQFAHHSRAADEEKCKFSVAGDRKPVSVEGGSTPSC